MKNYILVLSAALLAACSSEVGFTDGSTARTTPAVPPPPQTDDANGQTGSGGSGSELPPVKPQPQPFEASFVDGEERHVTVSIHPDTNEVKQSFELSVAPARERDFTQVDRPQTSDTFAQGKVNLPANDHLTLRQADVLLVVDNSDSMGNFQAQLSQGLAPLLSKLDNTDWQIAVVTTDNSCLRDLIKYSDWKADPAAADARFAAAVQPGTHGSKMERGIEMGFSGLNGVCRGATRPWRRNGATSVVLIMSNEENCGSAVNEGCPASEGYTHYMPQDFVDREPNVPVYALVWTEDTCGQDGYFKDPLEYEHLAEMTGGRWDVICQADYSNMMASISLDVSKAETRSFHLAHAPDGGSVQLSVGGVPCPTTYATNGNEIDLTGALPNGTAIIDVQYTWSEPRWSDVTLSRAAAPETLVVKVDGATLPAAGFSYKASTQSVHFTPSPAPGAAVAVAYRVGALNRDFSLGEMPVPDLVTVYVGATQVAAGDLAIADNVVTLAQAPADGAAVRVMYNVDSDVKTHYPLSVVDAATVDSLRVVENATGRTMNAVLEGDEIVVPEDDVDDGKDVTADITARLATLHLPATPIDGSVKAQSLPDAKDCDIKVDDATRQVDFKCQGDAHPTEISLTYATANDFTQAFRIAGAPAGYTHWQVWIDGKETKEFTHDDDVVTVGDDGLRLGSHVTVKISP